MKILEIEDYNPYPLKKRYGGIRGEHKGIAWIQKKISEYESLLSSFRVYKKDFLDISFEKQDEILPYWNNGYFSFIDVISLFGLVASRKPKKKFGNRIRKFYRDNKFSKKIQPHDENSLHRPSSS